MKILLFTQRLNANGGIANFYLTLSPYLTSDYHFVFLTSSPEKHIIKRIIFTIYDQIRIFFMLAFCGFDALYLNPSLRQGAIKRDMIYVFMAKLLKKKVIVFWHGWYKDCQKQLEKSKLMILFQKSFCKADLTFVLANEFKKKLQMWGNHNRIELMFTCYDDNALIEKKSFDFNSAIPLLFISRVEETKGIFIVLQAFELLEHNFPNKYKLTIAGDGTDLSRVKKYVETKKIKNIQFLGYVRGEEKINCFASHYVFILPTYGEGMPCALLEAMGNGLIPIVRSVGGIPDFFENDKMGIMTDSFAPQFYAEKIMQLVNNKQKMVEMSQYNQSYAKEHFTASQVASKIQKIINDTLD